LNTLPSVESVRRDASVWQLTTASLQNTLPGLLRMAEDERLGLHQLMSHTATLEDVFVALTGRHLRDE
jgi:ABC-2 type transport system ATP-binding protein